MRNERHVPRKDVRREYARMAARYDRRWSSYLAATTAFALAGLGDLSGRSLLDVGCGTGHLLDAIGRRWPDAALTGADLTREMLGIARARLSAQAGLVAARAERLPFADDRFDVVVSTSMLHFLAEPGRALGEMHRVGRRQGRLVLVDWCGDVLACRLLEAGLRLLGRTPGRVLRVAELDALLRAAGYRAIRIERARVGWLWGLMVATAVRTDVRSARGAA